MAIRIDVSGKVEHMTGEEKDGSLSLEQLKGVVDGYIEIVRLTENLLMVINDEGKVRNMPTNYIASILYSNNVGALDTIHGDVVLAHTSEVK